MENNQRKTRNSKVLTGGLFTCLIIIATVCIGKTIFNKFTELLDMKIRMIEKISQEESKQQYNVKINGYEAIGTQCDNDTMTCVIDDYIVKVDGYKVVTD